MLKNKVHLLRSHDRGELTPSPFAFHPRTMCDHIITDAELFFTIGMANLMKAKCLPLIRKREKNILIYHGINHRSTVDTFRPRRFSESTWKWWLHVILSLN